MNDQYLLVMENISKHFPGVQALSNVDLKVRGGTVRALLGENGAGKSTLMKILMGIIHKDSGTIQIAQQEVEIRNPREALNLGISIIPQELSPIPEMTVAENILLGRENTRGRLFMDYRKLNKVASDILDRLNVHVPPRRKMKNLTVAQIQLVEIAKAISYQSKIIIMDEPTSALGDREVDKLFEIISMLKKEGKIIIYVSHKLEEIFRIADDVSVLRDGKHVATEPIGQVDEDKLIRLMTGREIKVLYPKENIPTEQELLRVEHFSRKDEFEDISFVLRRGEILGLFGLLGAGRSEFLNSLFGVTRPESGVVFIDGKKVPIHRPSDAMEHGLALITEDRKKSGLFLPMSVKDNMSISSLNQFSRFVFVKERNERKNVMQMVDRLSVKTPSLRQAVENLSGGNQQKVIVGRWLMTKPRILLLDEPTRGIDVGAKREIHRFMSEWAQAGNGIILVSSELPELLGMSDRILVFKEGENSGIISQAEADQEKIMRLAV